MNDAIRRLVHLYEDGALSRRDLIQRLIKHTGSAAAAIAVMDSAGLAQTPTQTCPAGVQVPETDESIYGQMLTLHGEGGPLFAYQAVPRDYAVAPSPAVMVIHENRGLNEHIKDVTRRVAKAGFVAIAPDLLSRQGGTEQFADPEQAVGAYSRTEAPLRRQDMLSTLLTIRDQVYVRGDRLGAVGFCAGGGNVFDVAVNSDLLSAAVVFYGAAPDSIEEIANLQAPLLGIFAELDRGINSRLPGLLTALQAGNKRYALHVYENTNHAFHNDTGARYDAAAACDAWAKTISFLQWHLLLHREETPA